MSGKIYITEHKSDKYEREFAERTWLEYFNRYLYTNNLISEKEYKRMVEKISLRYVTPKRPKSLR